MLVTRDCTQLLTCSDASLADNAKDRVCIGSSGCTVGYRSSNWPLCIRRPSRRIMAVHAGSLWQSIKKELLAANSGSGGGMSVAAALANVLLNSDANSPTSGRSSSTFVLDQSVASQYVHQQIHAVGSLVPVSRLLQRLPAACVLECRQWAMTRVPGRPV